MMQTAGLAAKFGAQYDVPAIARLASELAPGPSGIDIMKAAGIASSLDAALATFRPQRVMFDAINAAGLGRQNATFAAQAAQILSSQESISRLVANAGGGTAAAGLFATMSRYGQVQAHLGSLAADPDIATLLRGSTRVAGKRYDAYLDGLPTRPTASRAAVAQHGGDTQTGLLIAESLTAAGLDDDDRDGLHDRMHRPGAAHRGSPIDDVTIWIVRVGASKAGLGGQESPNPTRESHVRHAAPVQSRRPTRVSQVEALATLVQDVAGNLQSVKHGDAPAMAVMRGWVQAAEGALSQLLLHS